MASTNAELDAFLGATPTPEPPPEAAAEPVEAQAAPEPEKAAEPAPKPQEDDDGDPPEPQAGEAVVPRRALEDERHKRNDWKEKAIRYEVERDELRKQVEAAQRAAAAPPPQPQPPPPPAFQQMERPDPSIDPVGYHAYMEQQRIYDGIVIKMNVSETMAREKFGDERVEAAIAEFKVAMNEDPSLQQRLIQQPHPYAWALKYLDKLKLQKEIGEDPEAYRERVRAEELQKLREAQGQDQAPALPRVSPAAGQAPSLATARSVAGRSEPAFTGPPSLDAIVAGISRRQAAVRH